MKLVYVITILFVVSLVLGIDLWVIKRKDFELETISRKNLESKFNDLEKKFIKRDSERKEVIKNLQKKNRSLREELYKAKHSKYSHKVIFKSEINDKYIDEKEYNFIADIITRNEDRKGYIEIDNNIFKIKDIDCVIKLNKE